MKSNKTMDPTTENNQVAACFGMLANPGIASIMFFCYEITNQTRCEFSLVQLRSNTDKRIN